MRYTETLKGFMPHQPITWPTINASGDVFSDCLNAILLETIIGEIRNVIHDALDGKQGNLGGRGHVVALALFCAVDSLAFYASKSYQVGTRYKNYIQEYFPVDYNPFAEELYKSYRNSLVHNWNLFEVAIYPGNEPISLTGKILNLGLFNFFDALESSVHQFLSRVNSDSALFGIALAKYQKLRVTAR